jgi:hypothetical protein
MYREAQSWFVKNSEQSNDLSKLSTNRAGCPQKRPELEIWTPLESGRCTDVLRVEISGEGSKAVVEWKKLPLHPKSMIRSSGDGGPWTVVAVVVVCGGIEFDTLRPGRLWSWEEGNELGVTLEDPFREGERGGSAARLLLLL